jgi:aspartate 1-decarboxylase
MLLKMLRAKIHRAIVTEANVNYVGSITIDANLLEATGILPGEAVLVADIANGTRHETYVIKGQAGSGVICINGAAARLVNLGDPLIIMAWGMCTPEEARALVPKIVVCDPDNRIVPPERWGEVITMSVHVAD